MQGNLKELSKNKTFGRKQPGDLLFAKGDSICSKPKLQGIYDIDDEDLCHKEYLPFSCEVPGCKHLSQTLLQSEEHYRTCHHFECAQCHKHIASSHLLDLHLCEVHDSFFALQAMKKPLFGCYVEGCEVKSWNAEERMQHCIEIHNYPRDFRFDENHKRSKKKQAVEDNSQTESLQTEKPNKKVTSKTKSQCLGAGGRGRGRMVLNWHQRSSKKTASSVSVPNDIDMKDMEEALMNCDK